MKKIIILLLFTLAFVFFLTGCDNVKNKANNNDGANKSDKNEEVVEKTWKDDCLDSRADRALSYLYLKNGTTGTLHEYYDDLLSRFSRYENENNLFVNKFVEEYEKVDYDSLEQREKDILNGLLFYMASGKKFNLDSPVEKAWLVGEGINNTNSQKHRKIVIKVDKKIYLADAIEMDFWINKKNKEEHSAQNYWFGTENNQNYDARRGINDPTKDSGIWQNALSDYYNNEKYVSLDTEYVNNSIQKHKNFLSFMSEYLIIYNDAKEAQEKEEREKEKEEKSKEPKVGMTKDEVLKGAWGTPKKKNITENRYGTHEQWVYDNGKYIYFDNGIVTSIQK